MATVKVKFRASSVATKEGTLFYQVIHKRIVRQIHTGYKLFPAEWDAVHSEIVLSSVTSESRRDYLLSLKNSLWMHNKASPDYLKYKQCPNVQDGL